MMGMLWQQNRILPPVSLYDEVFVYIVKYETYLFKEFG